MDWCRTRVVRECSSWAVKWKGNADVSRFAGQPIRLRFALKNSHLYAFQFEGS
jgi:hypothetical protein